MLNYIPNNNRNSQEKANSEESDTFDYIDIKAVEEINKEFLALPEIKRISILEERVKKLDPAKL